MRFSELMKKQQEAIRDLSALLRKANEASSGKGDLDDWDLSRLELSDDAPFPDGILENPLLEGYIDRKMYGINQQAVKSRAASFLARDLQAYFADLQHIPLRSQYAGYALGFLISDFEGERLTRDFVMNKHWLDQLVWDHFSKPEAAYSIRQVSEYLRAAMKKE